MHNSGVSNMFTEIYYPSQQSNCRTFSSPQKETPTHSVTLLFLPPLLKPMATTNPLSVSVDLPALDIAWKCSHIMCGLCWSLSLTQYNICEVRPRCVACQPYIAFLGWIIASCMDVPHFVHPSVDGRWCFHFWAIVYSAAVNRFLYGKRVLLVSGIYVYI